MKKNNNIVDIHEYIPILDYSKGMVTKAKKVHANNSRLFFESSTDVSTAKLYYSEIAASALKCNYLGDMLIPDVHYQLLILCAHMFRDYINSHFHFSSDIRLAELLDALDLISLPSYDSSCLMKIINNNERITSVSFVGFILKSMEIDNRLASVLNNLNMLYPKKLFWEGTMYIPSSKMEYIYFEESDFTQSLNFNSVKLEYGRAIKLPTSLIQRYNSHGVRHIENITLEYQLSSIHLNIELVNKPILTTNDSFELIFNKERYRFSYCEEKLEIDDLPQGSNIEIVDNCSIYFVNLALPFKIVNENLINKTGMIIRVTRWGNGPLTTFIPVYLEVL